MSNHQISDTGIRYLHINSVKNDKGISMKRYSVAYKKDGKWTNKTFYFGSRRKQFDAFNAAISFMIENNLTRFSLKHLKRKYYDFNHHII